MIIKMTIYSATLCFLCSKTGLVDVADDQILKSFFPVVWGNWYAAGYVTFYFFSPFINKLFNSLTQQEHKKLIVYFLIIWSVIPTIGFIGVIFPEITIIFNWNYRFGSFSFFFIMYAIGAYVRLYGYTFKKRSIFFLENGILGLALMFIMVLISDLLGLKLQLNSLVQNADFFSEYTMIPCLFTAVNLFVFFTKIEIKQSKIINILGTTTFGVYLIHIDNIAKQTIHKSVYLALNSIENIYLRVTCGVIIIYLFCSLVDIIYNVSIGRIGYLALNKLRNKNV